jgi:type IV pilus assembly protein PilA
MLSSVISRLNDRRDAAADLGEDAGFTLIELMVVLLILAILLAIAIPTFLGVTGGANDRAAQSNLNTSLTTAKAAATNNNQQYVGAVASSTDVTAALLKSNEPSINWVSGATSTQGAVSFYLDANSPSMGIILASPSKNNNTCWYAVDNLQALSAKAANGGYGDTAGTTASTNEAPATAGTYYGSGPQTGSPLGCSAASVSLKTGSTWSTSGF